MSRPRVACLSFLIGLLASAAAWAITYPDPDLDPRFGPPCTLSVTPTGSSERQLTWSPVTGASTYWVGFRRCDGSTEVLAAVAATSYTHAGFDPDECLEYLLVAYDVVGAALCSAHTAPVGSKCPCP
jgi:hypothetical protein